MRLVTYLPFYRIHEVELYFNKSVEAVKPDRSVVYLDNVFSKEQENIARSLIKQHELKFGDWGNRGSTWFSMLRDMSRENETTIIVDSDNVLDGQIRDIDIVDDVYTVHHKEEGKTLTNSYMKRSREGETLNVQGKSITTFFYRVYEGSVLSSGSTFFIGPKQAVIFKKSPDPRIIDGVERAFNSVQPAMRRFISDEAVLGVIVYLMGLREVRWFICSEHYHYGLNKLPPNKLLIALAHAQFASGLYAEFKATEFLRYWAKYRLVLIREALKAII